MKATEVTLKLNNGVEIPAVGLGTVFPPENQQIVSDCIITALRSGIRHIDTAWYYGSEPWIGVALKQAFDEGIVRREDVFITTKVWPSFHHDPLESLNQSLSALQLDYVDLLLQHWPVCFKSGKDGKPAVPKDDDGNPIFDKDADYLDTWRTLSDIYKNTNKVKAVGVSNYSVPYLKRLLKETDTVPVVNQVELHPQLPQPDLVDFCSQNNILIEAYSPLGAGGAPLLKVPIVKELAEKYKVEPVDILISFHVRSGRVVLPRTQNMERLKRGWEYVQLTTQDLAQLVDYGLENPQRYVRDPWGVGLGFEHWDEVSPYKVN